MFPRSKTTGFTLLELLIVMAIMSLLMAFSAPFITSLRTDIAMQQTLRQVKVDLVSTLNYSLAGKSFTALSKNDLMNPELIPEAYSLYFQKDKTYGNQTPYDYFEFTPSDSEENSLKVSYKKENDYPNSSVYLKEISLRNKEDRSSTTVDAASIFILPPFGKVIFLDADLESTENLIAEEFESMSKKYDQIKLTFQYKDDWKNISILTFDSNKILNIL